MRKAETIADPVTGATRRPDELLAIARSAAERDATAASTLVLQVGGAMLSTVRQVLGPAHPEIEDVTQEAVIAFLNSLKDFRGECSTRRYAQRVALFTALDARRRLVAQRRLIDSDQVMEDLPAVSPSTPLGDALSARRREIVRKVLDSLPDVIAQALALHFVLGYTVDEIASATSSPPNTIWSRLRLGKQALRRLVAADAHLSEVLGVDE